MFTGRRAWAVFKRLPTDYKNWKSFRWNINEGGFYRLKFRLIYADERGEFDMMRFCDSEPIV